MDTKQLGFLCCSGWLLVVVTGCNKNSDLTEGIPVDDAASFNKGPEGDSGVTYDSKRFALNSALGDIWGVHGNHFYVTFTLTNGNFLVKPAMIDGALHKMLVPVNASAVVHAQLHSPGASFNYMTYSFSSLSHSSEQLAGAAYFNEAYLGFDVNRSGQVEEDEKLAVVDGTFVFSGVLPDIALSFSVTLSDGQTAEGDYTGLFDFADRQGDSDISLIDM